MPTIQEIIDYYVNLLIIQYHDKPKAKADIELLINELFANNLIFDLERAFDIETAVGSQLDILAKYVGTARTLRGYLIENRQYFQLGDYASVVGKIGVRDYTTPRPEGEVFTYSYTVNSNSEYTLTDAELRFMIKLLIVRNNTTAGFKDIKELVFNKFDDLSVFDNQDMSLTYFTGLNINSTIRLAIAQDYLPRPACTGISVFSVKFPKKLFGFKSYTKSNTNVGFGDYTTQNEGSVLSYSDLVIV